MNISYIIRTDGGARGNPGPAGIGVVIEKNGVVVTEFGKTIGETTNNVAEYTAVIEALQYMKKQGNKEIRTVQFYLDSQLVVNQLNGLFKIKDSRLRELAFTIRHLEQEVGGTITYTSVPREQNKRADYFVNQALDESQSFL
ncbi:MAG: ribonuclease HI family protein [Candidatus Gottesmanbacteria bacterium]